MRIIPFLLLLLFLLNVCCNRDFYDILGLSKRATPAQIKKAYRKLSLEKHPDKAGNSPDITKEFQQIAEAYQVLSDPETRELYDKHGHEGIKNQGAHASQQNPFDIFSFFNGGQKKNEEEKRTPDVVLDVVVTLKELYMGATFRLHVQNQQLCPHCGGSGARSDADVVKCSSCQGKGVKMTTHQIMPGFVQQMQTTCEVCGGKGKIVKAKCPKCKGRKIVSTPKELILRVDVGSPDLHQIILESEGDESPDLAAGHLVFVIKTIPHSHFRREGNDLHVDMRVSLLEALLGMDRSLEHLDGHIVAIKKTSITKPGEVFTIRNEGMPHYGLSSTHGHLYIHFAIDFPKTLSQAQKEGLAKVLA